VNLWVQFNKCGSFRNTYVKCHASSNLFVNMSVKFETPVISHGITVYTLQLLTTEDVSPKNQCSVSSAIASSWSVSGFRNIRASRWCRPIRLPEASLATGFLSASNCWIVKYDHLNSTQPQATENRCGHDKAGRYMEQLTAWTPRSEGGLQQLPSGTTWQPSSRNTHQR